MWILGAKLESFVRATSALNNLWFIYVCVYVTVNVDRGHGLKRGHEKRKESVRVVMRRIISDEEDHKAHTISKWEESTKGGIV